MSASWPIQGIDFAANSSSSIIRAGHCSFLPSRPRGDGMMRGTISTLACGGVALLLGCTQPASGPAAGATSASGPTAVPGTAAAAAAVTPRPAAKERKFHFEYEVKVAPLPEGTKAARIWVPLPQS